MRKRLSTDKVHLRGIRDVVQFMGTYLDHGLPASVTDILVYAAYAVELRPYRLDASTVSSYISGVLAWHIEAGSLLKKASIRASEGRTYSLQASARAGTAQGLGQAVQEGITGKARLDGAAPAIWATFSVGYVLSRRSSRHQRLVFMFCTFGCLRLVATCYLRACCELIETGGGVSIRFVAPREDAGMPHVATVRNDQGSLRKLGGRSCLTTTWMLIGPVSSMYQGRFQLWTSDLCMNWRMQCSPMDCLLAPRCSPLLMKLLIAILSAILGMAELPAMGHPEALDVHLYGGGSARQSLGQ
ncbi:hypothetical protein CYMTET_34360 [Cymbomonas tetramitiformis]|uniref:Uncharacterized protein n=1 Tax=Cymbomonas tetramitiformis TaxID=36881 RepID=A0AAE0FB87_9CHLO|nr:hypothetical protein CYMTET_34360 [Cymbomonas tetramitiformis]